MLKRVVQVVHLSLLVGIADGLSEDEFSELVRLIEYVVKTKRRARPRRVKEDIFTERRYKNIKLRSEDVVEFDYKPTYCKRTYRMVALRKNLSVEKGELTLFDDVRYFFYITNDRSCRPRTSCKKLDSGATRRT